jgi:hypothetical protein
MKRFYNGITLKYLTECGVRPHYKSGRIVGGKASAFGAFPWQVLVRESTWLGLFTKNKCGGVLISNNYVITAGKFTIIPHKPQSCENI